MDRPGVGVGVYVRKEGKVLMGKRLSEIGRGTWCAPGGKLDMFEEVLDCARRETMEETGVDIDNARIIGMMNDISRAQNLHYITIAVAADWKSGNVHLMEPDKFSEWRWFSWNKLPQPLFVATEDFVNTGIDPFV